MSAMRRTGTGSGRPSGSNTPNRPGGPSRPNAPAASGPRAIFDKSRRIEEFSSSDDKCPQCKTDRYLNPRLRLLVSPCYHKMCESCIDRIFSLGPAPCPECGKKVSKNQFTAQTFQDLGVEREVAVRRTVAKLFNRREDDFINLKAYNDYLEEVEEITFNLIHEIDLPRTNAKLEQYQAAHRTAIASSAHISQQESDRQARLDEEEKQAKKARSERLRKEEVVEREEREKERVEMMRELERGADPEEVLEKQRKRRQEREMRQRIQEVEARRREKEVAQASANGENGAGATDRRPWSLDTILDFEGPLAYLDDASALFDVRKAPTALGGLEGVKGAAGYEDPWLKPTWVTKEMISRYRAGGFDWERQVWTRGIRAACEGIGAAPLSGNGDGGAIPSMEVDP
ncbi:related to TFB3 - TFIIH subunit (transcription/repair factor) [Melanopsichium pennsylvanicum]|uniref:RNA polymerase II transcription factor B subunit 3 n=2 Tax=Melanopsichium pennsylvanicum TaxID=63383 RepID=A0AAJ4XLB6_9BASI|nr:related to TFB3-TFIIH subunit (transcription/repair factor) [Melanopsichium pennsylvanicum 4]SNX84066.1 related to TFB3 - TFIIH subunit (transcription/repair factor) [Melanopsichium pennsylvanicum]